MIRQKVVRSLPSALTLQRSVIRAATNSSFDSSGTGMSKRTHKLIGNKQSGKADATDNAAFDRKLGLNSSTTRRIPDDPRAPDDYAQVRVPGPKQKIADGRNAFNRPFIEKKHSVHGWSPMHDRQAEDFYPEGNFADSDHSVDYDGIPNRHRDPSEIADDPYEREAEWSKALEKTKPAKGRRSNPQDLTTFESFSYSARSATYRAALNLGVHWGKKKSEWNPSMAPYLRGVVQGRHVFDLQVTLAQLRKMIRLLQSLIMDECNILFVCNSDENEDLKSLARIMLSRVDLPLLETQYTPGSLTRWDDIASQFRGPGRIISGGKPPSSHSYEKTKLHRMMQSPPDFIFLFNTQSYNQSLISEANKCGIPVAALCDSDDSTRGLQYLIACNTESIQSVHFILDMLTRGIIEAQLKRDSVWYAIKKDAKHQSQVLKQAESEWQANYDPYEMKRAAQMLTGGPVDEMVISKINTDFGRVSDEYNPKMFTSVSKNSTSDIHVSGTGGVYLPQPPTSPEQLGMDSIIMDQEQSKSEAARIEALKQVGVIDASVAAQQNGDLKQQPFSLTPDQIAYHTRQNHRAIQSVNATDDFSLRMLQRHLRRSVQSSRNPA